MQITYSIHSLDKGEATLMFGKQRDESPEAILGNVEQTMFGKSRYRNNGEKAVKLLCFVVRDHSRGLTALTLLIAESAPSNKDPMIRLIATLLDESGQ